LKKKSLQFFLSVYPPNFVIVVLIKSSIFQAGNTKGGSITVPLTSCLTGLESAE